MNWQRLVPGAGFAFAAAPLSILSAGDAGLDMNLSRRAAIQIQTFSISQ
jgi:hypothetical protein